METELWSLLDQTHKRSYHLVPHEMQAIRNLRMFMRLVYIRVMKGFQTNTSNVRPPPSFCQANFIMELWSAFPDVDTGFQIDDVSGGYLKVNRKRNIFHAAFQLAVMYSVASPVPLGTGSNKCEC